MKRLIVLLIVSMFITTPLISQDTGVNPDETTLSIAPSGEGTGDGAGDDSLSVFTAWDFIRMVLILGAVVAVIYIIFFLLKRSGNPKFQDTRLIKVLSSKTLSGSRTLHLVEVGNQIFLVGASESTINLVSEIVDKETLDGLRLQAESADSGERKNFGEVLTQVFRGNQKPVQPMSFLHEQRQRVKNM